MHNRTQWLAAIIENAEDAILSQDLSGVIVSWNNGAQRLFGFTREEAIGRAITFIVPRELHQEEVRLMDRILRGERVGSFDTVRMRKDGAVLDVSLTVSPVKDPSGKVVGASKVARAITERKRVDRARADEDRLRARAEAASEFSDGTESSLLLELQDEERRRIARELHDGVGQHIVALSLNATMILREEATLSSDGAQRVRDSLNLLEEVSREIRTMSYLLHPPLLDEAGLNSALRWYVEGFSERSRIAVRLDLPDEFERLPREHELCLFRIAQECLMNIHRHSGSITARVRLTRTDGQTKLEVSDDGRGIRYKDESRVTPGRNTGVGLRGMRERVRHLGGTLEIHSTTEGTKVTATLPPGKSKT